MGRKKQVFIRLITLGDQGLFAVGNFLLTVLLTRYYDNTAMAAYGIALSVALVLQGIQKNSYLIQNSVLERHIYKSRGQRILGEHMIAVFPIFVILSISSLFMVVFAPPTLFFQTFVATTACFAIYAQLEFERVLFIKYERYIVPFIMSFVFAGLIAVLFYFHEFLSFYNVLGVLILYAFLKTSIAFYIVGRMDLKGGFLLLLSDFRRNSLAAVMGGMGASGYTHAPVIALGMFSSPAQAAAFVALRGLMQPIQIIMRSMDVLDKNFFRSKTRGEGQSIGKVMLRQVLMYGIASSLISFTVCFFGEDIINLLYRGKHGDHLWLLYGWGIVSVIMAIILPVESAVIVKKYLNKYNFLRLWIGLAVCILCFVVISSYEAYAALVLTGGAMLISLTYGIYVVLRNQEGRQIS